ncbi:MAG: L-histidine N(alpha)-methyltransferase [Rickettsiales bacterium]|nr:L-histidine N(alpha)-methyltransferase [Rickettsiales bacterium]
MLDKEKIAQDFINLFLNKKKGHLTEYVYYGEDFFGQLIKNNKNYYPYHSEIKLISDNQDLLSRTLGINKNIVEIGPGSQESINNKTIPLIKTLQNVSSYTAIDSNLPYAQYAAHHVQKLTGISTHEIQSSFFGKKQLVYPTDLVLILLGITFCNTEDTHIETFFKNTAEQLRTNDHFIFSIDANTNPDLINKAYNNTWLEGLAFNVFLFFKKLFNIEKFNPKLFKYKFHWHQALSEVQIYLTATEAQNFIFNNHKITIKPQQDFHIITSRKRPESFYKKILKDNNIALIKTLEQDSDNLKIYITQAL